MAAAWAASLVCAFGSEEAAVSAAARFNFQGVVQISGGSDPDVSGSTTLVSETAGSFATAQWIDGDPPKHSSVACMTGWTSIFPRLATTAAPSVGRWRLAPGACARRLTCNCPFMYLDEMATPAGRKNNFNAIRLMAALGVLASHSFVLASGDPTTAPLYQIMGMTIGDLCVVVFFIISGYLVAGSLLSHGDPVRFLVARATRIYPALIVVIALTALIGGPMMSSLAPNAYFTDPGTYKYLLTNALSLLGPVFTLPGVFEHTPFHRAVNASIWTISFELWMYAMLLTAWIVCAATRFRHALTVVALGLIAVGTAFYWHETSLMLDTARGLLGWLMSMFFLGVVVRLLSSWIPLHWSIAAVALIALMALALLDLSLFKAAYPLCVAYLVFFAAFSLPALNFVQRHDYSYGLYLYAFPVQQALASLVPGISVLKMMLLAIPISLAFAAVSWHFIEKPALARVDRLAGWLRRVMGAAGARPALASVAQRAA